MKKRILRISFLVVLGCCSAQRSHAQVLEIIQEVVTKVIVAIDLQVQRLQNKTIVLQDAQKQLENTLSELKLKDIGDWCQKQKDLYANYFKELNEVKTYITEYHEVKELIAKQKAIVTDYQQAMALFRQDNHFSASEIQHMESVYQGMLSDAGQWVDMVNTVLQSLVTSMTDAQRLHQINTAAAKTTSTYDDLQAFTRQNQVLSLQRSKDEEEINQIKKLYALP